MPLFHTMNIYTRTSSHYNSIIQKILTENDMLSKNPYPIRNKGGYVYLLKREYGITCIILWDKRDVNFEYHAVEIRLNPKRLLENDNYTDITYFEELKHIEKEFNAFIETFKYYIDEYISFSLPPLSKWKVSRYDPAVDIIVKKPGQYMELLGCGDLPKGYTHKSVPVYQEEDPMDKSVSFYAESKSRNITFNFYHKGKQQERRNADYNNMERSKYKIRFEVQCEKSKIYNIVRKYGLNDNTFASLANPEITKDIIIGYYKRIFGTGDYYSLKEAKKQIEASALSKTQKNNLIEVLEVVKLYRNIRRAREAYVKNNNGSENKFNRCLDLLDKNNINPVTIPKRFEKKRMDNPFDKLEQQLLPEKYYIHINL